MTHGPWVMDKKSFALSLPSKSITIGTLLENLVDNSKTASLAGVAVVVVAIVLVSHNGFSHPSHPAGQSSPQGHSNIFFQFISFSRIKLTVETADVSSETGCKTYRISRITVGNAFEGLFRTLFSANFIQFNISESISSKRNRFLSRVNTYGHLGSTVGALRPVW